MAQKIGMISLGCPKNQVDSELMLAKLARAGYALTDTPVDADAVIINTCGFIQEAKQEAIETILEMAQHKEDGNLGKILVVGCMAQRYRDEILRELPEADAVAGLGINGDIVAFVRAALDGTVRSAYPPLSEMPLGGERLLTTPPHWAYLRIADGCSNRCSYCAIPAIRGDFRSRPLEELVREAEQLAAQGVQELLVIAQDTTRYGEDLYGQKMLPALLRRLDEIEGLEWIRLLYCYPDRITDELLATIRDAKHVLHYIDLPVQHADARILRAMNRKGDKDSLLALLAHIRSYLPDCVLRTTLITGFPGEDERAFETLTAFVREAKFDRLGCFAYSPEEGTPAAALENRVDRSVAEHRGEIIMEQQHVIFSEKQRALLDTVRSCVVDSYDGYNDCYYGRTWRDAPEIDSLVAFTSDRDLDDGQLVHVELLKTDGCDLIGRLAE